MQTKELSRWYQAHHRKLPWRESHDPYRIWISEIMLQQTQVATVIPYYEKFMALFPTVEKLAAAPEEKVLAAWAGLGYYSRAKNLHKGAKFLVEKGIPTTREGWLEVPGIGPYTAGAVTSIAFDLPSPIVDGNVQRVFSRYYGMRTEIERKENQLFFWKKAAEWAQDAKSPRILNQALMELGATICIKGTPRCERCPIKTDCVAFAKNLQTKLPVRKARRAHEDLLWFALVVETKDSFFLHQNETGQWWSGMWDIPRVTVPTPQELENVRHELVKKFKGILLSTPLSTQKHTVTHHRISVVPHHVHLKKETKLPGLKGQWVKKNSLPSLPVSSLVRKVMRSLDTPPTME